MKKVFIALSAILVWTAIPAVSAHAVSIGQACAKTTLGTRVSIRVNKKPVIVVCRNVDGRKKWIRAAVQTMVTTTTSTTTSATTSTTTSTTSFSSLIVYLSALLDQRLPVWLPLNFPEFHDLEPHIIVKVNPKYYRDIDIECLIGDSSRARNELKWLPKYSFEDLVKEMVVAAIN